MWENELIMYRFGFLLLIGIFLLLLAIYIKQDPYWIGARKFVAAGFKIFLTKDFASLS